MHTRISTDPTKSTTFVLQYVLFYTVVAPTRGYRYRTPDGRNFVHAPPSNHKQNKQTKNTPSCRVGQSVTDHKLKKNVPCWYVAINTVILPQTIPHDDTTKGALRTINSNTGLLFSLTSPDGLEYNHGTLKTRFNRSPGPSPPREAVETLCTTPRRDP